MADFATLLQRSSFAHVSQHPAYTWYEWFFLAAALTPNPVQLVQSNSGVADKHIANILREFAAHAVKLIKFALEVEQQQLVAASNNPTNPVALYGFTNRPLHTKLVLSLDIRVAKALDLTLLNITQHLTLAQRTSYDNGTLQLRTRKNLGLCHSNVLHSLGN